MSPVNPNHLLLTENGQVYVQKKPTMYPPWNSTFDAHINNGRVMHIVVKDKSAEMVSETTVELKVLAERCKKSNGKTEIWVSIVISSCRMGWGAAVGYENALCPCQAVTVTRRAAGAGCQLRNNVLSILGYDLKERLPCMSEKKRAWHIYITCCCYIETCAFS